MYDIDSLVKSFRIIDLAQPCTSNMPSSPNAPGFRHALWVRHGDVELDDGLSFAADIIITGGHVGTHIDAICHISERGLLHGGLEAKTVEAVGRPGRGFARGGIDEIKPMMGRAVLLDIARLRGKECLDGDDGISADDLQQACDTQNVEVRPGDVVLVHTGWDQLYDDNAAFIGAATGSPGPDKLGGQWLADRRVSMVGSETIFFEHIPADKNFRDRPVHRILLFQHGIHIFEVMRLSELATELAVRGEWAFLFIMAPINIIGATGAPVRPLALLPSH
jgi:kynurenine formamidase